MGKGTRNRNVRAEDKVAAPSKQVQKQNKSVFYGTIGMAAFALVLVVFLVFNALAGTGMFMRARTAVESNDFEVDGAMMSYFVRNEYDEYVQYIQQYYTNFGLNYTWEQACAASGIDPDVSLKKQVQDKTTGKTWLEYFAETAATRVENLLIYCQAAKTAGVVLEKEDYDSIDGQLEYMEFVATYSGYNGVDHYLSSIYGEGVKEKDVRKAMEIQALASKMATKMQESFHDAAMEDKASVETFFNENKNDYISADYLSYTFSVTLKELKALEENKDKTEDELKELYDEKKAELALKADELKALTTIDEFKAYVKEQWLAEEKEDLYKKYYDAELKDVKEEDLTDEKKAAAEKTANEKVEEDAQEYLDNLLREKYAHPGEDNLKDNELAKWIFGYENTNAATVNSTTKIENDADKDVTDETKKTYSYSVTVYFLTRAASRVEDTTRDFHYILLQPSEKDGDKLFTDAQIQEMFKEFKDGEKHDVEALEALAEKWTDTEKGLSANVNELTEFRRGSAADEIDEWLFSDERKAGDFEMIKYTEYSSSANEDVTYYFIVFVDEIGPAEWFIDARDGKVSKDLNDWFDAQAKIYPVTVNQKAINKVRI